MGNSKTKYACGKCDGAGRIEAFGHYDNGKCFACMGAGWVEGRSYSAMQVARMNAGHTVGALEDAIAENVNNLSWVTHMCKRAAGDMLAMQDREYARKLLARLPQAMQAEIIAAGRALKGN
jgi:hypothetical protein